MMRNAVDRLAEFVDALLHERRPPRFPAEPDEAPGLYAASALKAARPGADLPSREFVAGLERKLAAEVARAEDPPTSASRFSRRTLLQLTGLSAAAAFFGYMLDNLLNRDEPPLPGQLVAGAGRWVPVVSAVAVQPGQAVRFSAGAVEGFVVNNDGKVQAMSAICTHMGCVLRFNPTRESLDCPCHGASFDLDGAPQSRAYLSSLPRMPSRVRAGAIEVEIPAQA